MPPLPSPVRAALGLAVTMLDEARHLPDKAIEIPMLAISRALQLSLRLQQHYIALAARGDELLASRNITDEPPPWATFDAPVLHADGAEGLETDEIAPDDIAAGDAVGDVAAGDIAPDDIAVGDAVGYVAATEVAPTDAPAKPRAGKAAPRPTQPRKTAPRKARPRPLKTVRAPRTGLPSAFDSVTGPDGDNGPDDENGPDGSDGSDNKDDEQ